MDPGLIALSDLIQTDDHTGVQVESSITEAVRGLVERGYTKDTDAEKDGVRAKLQHVSSMLNADVLCQEIETSKFASSEAAEIEVAIEIFSRLNSGGVNLSPGDVEVAKLAQQATSKILGPMRDFARQPACVALGLNFVFLTRALATIRRGSARLSRPKNWAAGEPDIKESWEDTARALGASIDLVQRMGWASRRWLASTSALLPVAYFAFQKGGSISKGDAPEVARFLCLAAWTGAFSKASETAIDQYLRRLTKAGPGRSAKVLTETILKARVRKVRQDDILAESKMTGALMQIYLAYLVAQRATSWPSGELVANACKIPDGKGSLDVHHIFPRKFVERVEGNLDVNTMGNYAILTQEDNALLGDEDPKVAYGKLTVDQKRSARKQFIPFGDEDALLPDAYEVFIKRRAREMAEALNDFLGL